MNEPLGTSTAATVAATEAFATCEQCCLSSPLAEVFQSIKRGRRRLLLCPQCAAEEHGREMLKGLVGVGFFAGVGGFVAAVGGENNAGWLPLNFVLFNVMMWLSTIPHEAGHALAARAMGLDVYRIVLGTGRLLGSVTVMGIPVEIRVIPLGGLTYVGERAEPAARIKHILIVAAGPMVDFALLSIAWGVGIEIAIAEKLATGPAPVCAFIGASVFAILVNLTPFRARTHAGIVGTDGAQLLSLISTRQAPWEQRVHQMIVHRAQLLVANERADAESFARAALEKYPADPYLLFALSNTLIQQQRYAESREVLLELLRHLPGEQATPFQALIFNNIAWFDILLGEPARIEEARHLSAAAYRLVPWEAYAASTYGSFEALHGDPQVARSALERALLGVSKKEHRAAVLSGLAIAQARLGNREAAAAALAEARANHATCPLLAIARERLAATPQTPIGCESMDAMDRM